MEEARRIPNDWCPDPIPANVEIDKTAHFETAYFFSRFRSKDNVGLRAGPGSSAYAGTMFDVGVRGRVVIGSYVMLNGTRLVCDNLIEIGDYCLISWNVVLMDSYRVPVKAGLRRAYLDSFTDQWPRQLAAEVPALPIRIGANVWIGFDSCIMPGVTIGPGAVIGARSVVWTDVPAYSVAVGNPARVVRYLEQDGLSS